MSVRIEAKQVRVCVCAAAGERGSLLSCAAVWEEREDIGAGACREVKGRHFGRRMGGFVAELVLLGGGEERDEVGER